MNHLAERQGVMNGVAVSVVIEVRKDVLTGMGPFAYPVCPPRQVRIGVRARIEVVRVRAMQANVCEWRCDAQDAG